MAKESEDPNMAADEDLDGATQKVDMSMIQELEGGDDASGGASGSNGDSESAELKAQLMRVAADFENFKKRSAKEREELRDRSAETVLRDFLPVMDNLTRALEHADDSPLAEGLRMVEKQFQETLAKHEVTEVETTGSAFDPAVHEALSQAPSEDVPEGSILQQVEAGYMRKGRLIRPAKVVVSTGQG